MRKKHNEEHENNERWLLTYADMITLLMAFFIMMYSMSVLNISKFRQAAISIRSGFGGAIRGQGKAILGSSGMFAVKPSPIEGDTAGVSWKVLRPLVDYIDENDKKEIEIGKDQRGIVITIHSDSLMFEPGSAMLTTKAHPYLKKIAETLSEIDNNVQVEGHTCNLPTRQIEFPSNWELSTARATSVLRFLVERCGVDPMRISAAGYASTRPIAPNDSEENRKKNRRVEIIIMRPESDVEPSQGDMKERMTKR